MDPSQLGNQGLTSSNDKRYPRPNLYAFDDGNWNNVRKPAQKTCDTKNQDTAGYKKTSCHNFSTSEGTDKGNCGDRLHRLHWQREAKEQSGEIVIRPRKYKCAR